MSAPVAATTGLSPQMGCRRLEYLVRANRVTDSYAQWNRAKAGTSKEAALGEIHSSAIDALRDIERQIYETPIVTLADALFIVRLHLALNGQIGTIPKFCSPDEAALLNGLRTINAAVGADTFVNDDPKSPDAWLSQKPYAENRRAAQ